jgi:hypothetical protein
MTIAIEDISTTEQLDREALTAVRGGYATMPATISTSSPWDGWVPQFPSFPSGFPFDGSNPVLHPEPTPQLLDPQNPLLQ